MRLKPSLPRVGTYLFFIPKRVWVKEV